MPTMKASVQLPVAENNFPEWLQSHRQYVDSAIKRYVNAGIQYARGWWLQAETLHWKLRPNHWR